jgi:hypothetical protein
MVAAVHQTEIDQTEFEKPDEKQGRGKSSQ